MRGRMEEAMGHFGPIKSLDDLPVEKALIGYVRKAAELRGGIKFCANVRPKASLSCLRISGGFA